MLSSTIGIDLEASLCWPSYPDILSVGPLSLVVGKQLIVRAVRAVILRPFLDLQTMPTSTRPLYHSFDHTGIPIARSCSEVLFSQQLAASVRQYSGFTRRHPSWHRVSLRCLCLGSGDGPSSTVSTTTLPLSQSLEWIFPTNDGGISVLPRVPGKVAVSTEGHHPQRPLTHTSSTGAPQPYKITDSWSQNRFSPFSSPHPLYHSHATTPVPTSQHKQLTSKQALSCPARSS